MTICASNSKTLPFLWLLRKSYKYRRNDYTHATKEYTTNWSAWPRVYKSVQDALDVSPETTHGWELLTLYENNDPQSDVELTVLVNKDESYMLQLAVIGYCRKLLALTVDQKFVEQHTAQRRIWRILKEAQDELNHNWQTYKYYSITWMFYEDKIDLYYGLPEFKLDWLAAVRELILEEYGPVAKELQRNTAGAIARLKAMNEPIQRFNNAYPPLHIRQKREDLRGVSEDLQIREQNKSRLFNELQSMYEYHSVRWYLAQIKVDLSVIAKTIPVKMEQGIQVYGSSTPDYRGWL